MATSVVRYAVYLLVFAFVVGGAYCSGYAVGSANTKVEYITKDVIKYVEIDKAKSEIYSKPNATREQLLDLMKNNML